MSAGRLMRPMVRAALALLSAGCAVPAMAQDIAVTNARIVVGDGSDPVQGGTVVVQGGKVVAAGSGVAIPAGVRTIDAQGKWVTPGLVAAVTDLGLLDVNGVADSNDSGAGDAVFNAGLDVAPAINPAAVPIAVNRAGGITRAAVAPSAGNAIFAGQGAIIDLGSDPQAVTSPRAFQFVELGERGAALAGGSRSAAHAALRNALAEARELSADPAGSRRDDVLLTRSDAVALVPVVTGRQMLFVHVERAQDIRMVLALKQDFPSLRLVIVGGDEGWLAARELAAAGVPVIANPLTDLPSQFESIAATQSNVGRMAAAGVTVGVGNLSDKRQPRYQPQYAGNLVALAKVPGASGLSWGSAFAAISSVPAEIIGQGDHFGSLKPGYAGDVVIWDGDPLELSSAPVAVFIDGIEQNLTNRQTRLRDRYRDPAEGALPKAYDW